MPVKIFKIEPKYPDGTVCLISNIGLEVSEETKKALAEIDRMTVLAPWLNK